MILIVYVDDIIITRNRKDEAKRLEDHLIKHFEVKRHGPLKYFLGIEIAKSNRGLLMTQQKYVPEVIKDTKLLQCHTNDTPIEVNHKLTLKEDDPRIEMTTYEKLIARLLYLSHISPDIFFSMNVLSQFTHSPRRSHFQATLRVLRYLKGTTGLGLSFMKTCKLDLVLYVDFDYAGLLIDSRSTTGFCTMSGGNLVMWRTKKQSMLSKLNTEAELRDTSSRIDEVYHYRIKHVNNGCVYIKEKLNEKSTWAGAVESWPTPTALKQLWGFLDLTGGLDMLT